jgi:hypothetical protein
MESIMKIKGRLITFEIASGKYELDILDRNGFEKYTPEWSAKSVCLQAIKDTKRDLGEYQSLIHREIDKTEDTTTYALRKTYVGRDEDHNKDLGLEKLCNVKISKRGDLDCTGDQVISDLLRANYKNNREQLDATRLRPKVVQIIKNVLYGIPMRKGGGVYFVDETFNEDLDRLRSLMKEDGMSLHEFVIYDDSETLDAIEYSANSFLSDSIESAISKFEKDLEKEMSGKTLDRHIKDVKKLGLKAERHAENLREAYESTKVKVDRLLNILNKCETDEDNKVETFDIWAAFADS